jgi:hypothetical protein
MLAIGTKPSGLRCSYRRSINNGNGLDNLLLVGLGTGTVEVTDDGGHTSLVTHSGSQVDGLLGVVLGEAGEAQQISDSVCRKGVRNNRSHMTLLLLFQNLPTLARAA